LSLSYFVQKYLSLTLEVVEQLNKCVKFFAAIILQGTSRTFQWQIVSVLYCPPVGKVWLSSVCWPPSAKLGNEVECRIYGA